MSHKLYRIHHHSNHESRMFVIFCFIHVDVSWAFGHIAEHKLAIILRHCKTVKNRTMELHLAKNGVYHMPECGKCQMKSPNFSRNMRPKGVNEARL